jgi:hypothetical protein
VFNQFGDLERCSLRPGNVHSADGWGGVLKPVVERYQGASGPPPRHGRGATIGGCVSAGASRASKSTITSSLRLCWIKAC